MKESLVSKSFVFTIILLFIGVAVAPSINFSVVKASNDNDLVEVTTQACGIKGYGNTTVKLTREQYQNLEQYLVDFRARLNQTTTRGEAVPIFKEAVVELNRYGLLPRGMSVEQAQKLTTGYGKSTNVVNRIHSSEGIFKCSNLFCLIAGKADKCLAFNLVISGLKLFLFYLDEHSIDVVLLLSLISLFGLFKNELPNRIMTLFNFLSLLTFGWHDGYGYVYPSNGWVFTVGLLGIGTCNGQFFGQIPFPVDMIFYYYSRSYTGAFGFTGIRIILPDYSSFFLGTALRVNIDDSQP